MLKGHWKATILARRATFIVASAAGVVPAVGCKDKVEVIVDEPLTCLTVRGGPGARAKGEEGSMRDDSLSFGAQKGDRVIASGTV